VLSASRCLHWRGITGLGGFLDKAKNVVDAVSNPVGAVTDAVTEKVDEAVDKAIPDEVKDALSSAHGRSEYRRRHTRGMCRHRFSVASLLGRYAARTEEATWQASA